MATGRSARVLGGTFVAAAVSSPCRCIAMARPTVSACSHAGTNSRILDIGATIGCSYRFFHDSVQRGRKSISIKEHDLAGEEEKDDDISDNSKNGFPRNERILSTRVRLVDPETNEMIDGIFETRQLLATIDRTRFALVQVAAGNTSKRAPKAKTEEEHSVDEKERQEAREASSAHVTMDDLPICKLVNMRDEYMKERAAKKAMFTSGGRGNRSDAKLHKEVVLTWHATSHDRQHKLQPVRLNMIRRGQGATCKVIVSTKKGNRNHLPLEEKHKMLHEVEQFLCDWSDAPKALATTMTSAAENGEEGKDDAEVHISSTETPSAVINYFPRRRGDVDWKKDRQATLIVEVVRRQ